MTTQYKSSNEIARPSVEDSSEVEAGIGSAAPRASNCFQYSSSGLPISAFFCEQKLCASVNYVSVRGGTVYSNSDLQGALLTNASRPDNEIQTKLNRSELEIKIPEHPPLEKSIDINNILDESSLRPDRHLPLPGRILPSKKATDKGAFYGIIGAWALIFVFIIWTGEPIRVINDFWSAVFSVGAVAVPLLIFALMVDGAWNEIKHLINKSKVTGIVNKPLYNVKYCLFLRSFKSDYTHRDKINEDLVKYGVRHEKFDLRSHLKKLIGKRYSLFGLSDGIHDQSTEGLITYRATDGDWRRIVARSAQGATCIFFAPALTSGTSEEIKFLINEKLLGKTVFVMPPSVGVSHDMRDEWRSVQRAYGKLGLEMPSYSEKGAFFVFYSEKSFNILGSFTDIKFDSIQDFLKHSREDINRNASAARSSK